MKKGIEQNKEFHLPDLGAVRQVAGHLDGRGLKIGIVVSRFNEALTGNLVQGAVKALEQAHVQPEDIIVVWVPGAYEVPAMIQRLAERKAFDALIALGAVLQGETRHAEMIDQQAAQSLSRIGRDFNVPVIYEIVSTYTLEQARSRCTDAPGGRGWYAGLAAIEMARVHELFEEC